MELLLPGFGLIFWTLVAFLIVLFVLKKYAWKPILESLKERELGISSAISAAEVMKADMAKLKSENEAILAEAREERARMIKGAKETADKMMNDAKERGKNEYDRVVADAQVAINQQKNAALTEVKNQVGKLVIEVSEKVLRRELATKDQQEVYIKDLAEGVKLN